MTAVNFKRRLLPNLMVQDANQDGQHQFEEQPSSNKPTFQESRRIRYIRLHLYMKIEKKITRQCVDRDAAVVHEDAGSSLMVNPAPTEKFTQLMISLGDTYSRSLTQDVILSPIPCIM